MPRNGSGGYSLPQAPFAPNTTISSAAVNSDFSDIATALTGSVASDGQTTMTGPLVMNSATAGISITGNPDAVITVQSKYVPLIKASAQTSSFLLAESDIGTVFLCNGTSITATLPDATVVGNGWSVSLKNTGTAIVTIATSASQLFNGATTQNLLGSQLVQLISDGTAFYSVIWDTCPTVGKFAFSTGGINSVDFVLPSGYTAFDISVANLSGSAASVLAMRYSVNGGASFDTTAGHYFFNDIFFDTSSFSTIGGTSTQWFLTGVNMQANSSIGANAQARLVPSDGASYSTLLSSAVYCANTSSNVGQDRIAQWGLSGGTPVNAIRVFLTTGTITKGSIVVKGFAP